MRSRSAANMGLHPARKVRIWRCPTTVVTLARNALLSQGQPVRICGVDWPECRAFRHPLKFVSGWFRISGLASTAQRALTPSSNISQIVATVAHWMSPSFRAFSSYSLSGCHGIDVDSSH